MEMMEVVLLIAGGIIFILSFFIPDKKKASGKDGSAEGAKALTEGELQGLISQEMNSIRTHVDDVVEEAVTYAMEKTERSLERLSNEKIMAVSEYSDTVLAEIHKNHEEAMFLYDMLNNKHTSLKNTVTEVNRTIKEAETAVMNFQKMASEPLSPSVERNVEPVVQREPGRFVAESFGMEKAGIAVSGTGVLEQTGTEKNGSDGFRPGILTAAEPEKPEIQNPGTDDAAAAKNEAYNGAEDLKIQNVRLEKDIIQQTGTEKAGLERPDVFSGSTDQERAGSLQSADAQRRNSNDRILELFQQGKSTVAIARELGLGVGEVKLVIDLFKNQ